MTKKKNPKTRDVKKWLAIRKKAGLKIDPKTVEVMSRYAETLDLYGLDSEHFETYGQIAQECDAPSFETNALQNEFVGILKKKCRALLRILKKIQKMNASIIANELYCHDLRGDRMRTVAKNAERLGKGSGSLRALEQMDQVMGNICQLIELSIRDDTKLHVHRNATIDAAISLQAEIGKIGSNHRVWAGDVKSRL